MSELRARASELRAKAVTGEVGVLVARDLSVRLPRELAEHVQGDVRSGLLAKRWAKALEEAQHLGEEAPVAALATLLLDVVKLAGARARTIADELEARRQQALGRAAGIHEAVDALESAKGAAPEAED